MDLCDLALRIVCNFQLNFCKVINACTLCNLMLSSNTIIDLRIIVYIYNITKQVRAVLAACIESVIILDRLLFLQEQVRGVYITLRYAYMYIFKMLACSRGNEL